jgi:excisionase family DNA binding protein
MTSRRVTGDSSDLGIKNTNGGQTGREHQVWPEIFDVADAAAFLRVSPATVRVALANKKLPGKRVGKEWRLSRSALIAWLSTPGEPKHYPARAKAS